MRKLSHAEILERQKDKIKSSCLPLCVVLNDIRSLHNVGSIFRTSDGAGIEKIWLCGITGYPPHPQIAKTAIGAEQRIEWDYRKDARGLIRKLKAQGYQIVLLEQMECSVEYQKFKPKWPTCLVLGSEISGISDDLADLSDAAVEIEMAGLKNSLNVAVAFGIVAYHFRSCFKNKCSQK